MSCSGRSPAGWINVAKVSVLAELPRPAPNNAASTVFDLSLVSAFCVAATLLPWITQISRMSAPRANARRRSISYTGFGYRLSSA
jgi:hypothetical protein